jgi:hypothetical protein
MNGSSLSSTDFQRMFLVNISRQALLTLQTDARSRSSRLSLGKISLNKISWICDGFDHAGEVSFFSMAGLCALYLLINDRLMKLFMCSLLAILMSQQMCGSIYGLIFGSTGNDKKYESKLRILAP